jgi:hypothetical protein
MLPASQKNTELFICNVMGEVIHKMDATNANQELHIDLSEQPNGIYFVHIKTGTVTATRKLVLAK